MVDKFLKAKHWQLFFLLIGVPFGSFLTIIAIIVSILKEGTQPDPEQILNIFKFFPLVIVLFASLLFSWFWSVAIGLQKAVPTNVEMKTTKFKIFSIIPLLSVSGFGVFMFILYSTIKPNEIEFPSEWIAPIMLVLCIVSAFGVFYSIYFAAKTLKTTELQREVTFSDFASEFFMFWFFPVGIWILQPRINTIREENITIDENMNF